MPCYNPLQAFQSKSLKNNGKREILFKISLRNRFSYEKIQLPCGQCVGCRLERSRQWAVRCMHEASLYENNCFITLTYDNEHLPKDGSLDVREFQLFMKRFRDRCQGLSSVVDDDGNVSYPIRFYHCGEYGEKFKRPHYHACIFNYDFPDKQLFKINNGFRLYTSKLLQDLWPFGFSTIGDVTFESAAYVARYIMKKKFGKDAWVHYAEIDWNTGEILGQRKPEYTTMSRRPGIGKDWLDKYFADVYPSDFVLVNGKRCKPPRYYDSQFEIHYPSDFSALKQARRDNSKKFESNNTPQRLRVREQVQLARLNMLPRNLE